MTAAHKTLRYGTKVRVTNLWTKKSCIVRVNNRGPYVKGRVIDLSVAAAKEIGSYGSGVVPVKLEVVQ
jgi:rare lipoprotein A